MIKILSNVRRIINDLHCSTSTNSAVKYSDDYGNEISTINIFVMDCDHDNIYKIQILIDHIQKLSEFDLINISSSLTNIYQPIKDLYVFDIKSFVKYCKETFNDWKNNHCIINLNGDSKDNYINYVAKYIEFDKWFDKESFEVNKYSEVLCTYCYKHFDKWFDKESFDIFKYSEYLACYCHSDILNWWDPNRVNYTTKVVKNLTTNLLYEFGEEKLFNLWWNPNKIIFDEHIIFLLNEYYKSMEDIWGPYIVLNKII